jgi:hypothetical protein
MNVAEIVKYAKDHGMSAEKLDNIAQQWEVEALHRSEHDAVASARKQAESFHQAASTIRAGK